MSLKNELLKYLRVAKKDATKDDAGLLSQQIKIYKNKVVLDTAEFAKKVAGFIGLIYFLMPEIPKADPLRIKVQPLCQHCVRLAEKRARNVYKRR